MMARRILRPAQVSRVGVGFEGGNYSKKASTATTIKPVVPVAAPLSMDFGHDIDAVRLSYTPSPKRATKVKAIATVYAAWSVMMPIPARMKAAQAR